MRRSILAVVLCLWGQGAVAGPADFHAGSVISDYGRIAPVPGAIPLPSEASFKIAFDVAEAAESGAINRRMASAARLINMHGAAGLSPEQTKVAIVVHGPAAMDLVRDDRYGGENANAGLIAALIDAGVTVTLCGQTAAARDITVEDLLPGVSMSLSAMTAHAVLQNQGYTLNPF